VTRRSDAYRIRSAQVHSSVMGVMAGFALLASPCPDPLSGLDHRTGHFRPLRIIA
jgi:hypothetical protein